MADLAIITPSRGRPKQLAELIESVYRMSTGSIELWVGLDDDDPADYFEVCQDAAGSHLVRPYRGHRRSLSGWTNHLAAAALAGMNPPRYLASLGDDHRPRTPGWDQLLIQAIKGLDAPGFAYGNDLLQGANLPTAWVVSADIVTALGWMMLPCCEHMYVDSAIGELGKESGRIVYRPDVIVEHLHPLAGKADWDDSYRASNTPARYAADRAAFELWQRDGGLAGDAAKLAALTREKAVT